MNISQQIEGIIADSLHSKGYAIVRVLLSGEIRRTLQIMIERLDGQAITVDDCATASYTISALLDVEDVIKSHYILEVSSPGLDRPLVKIADYHRFVGHLVVVKTTQAINKRKTFPGKLESATETAITIKLDQPSANDTKVVEIPYGDIRSAHLQVVI
mgnify:CR=1 FL=1